MMLPKFTILDRTTTVEEYRSLRESVGWASPPRSKCQAALAQSLFGVVALRDGITVGMGRVVGDGAVYATIVDVVVAEGFHGHGIGQAIINRLIEWASTCGISHIGLVADDSVADYYAKWSLQSSGQYLRLSTTDPIPPTPQRKHVSR